MKAGCLLLSVFLMANGFLSAQNSAPSWYHDKELQYPSRLYIAVVGEGKTRAEAEAVAVAGVSMFFNTRTEVRNEAIREFNETIVNNAASFSGKTYISESAVIQSTEEFLGVRFANPWQNTKTQAWVTLAYIDKKEAAGIYEARITANMASINSLTNDADKENEKFYACSLLSHAIRIGSMTEELIRTASIVDPQAREKYAPMLAVIVNTSSKYRKLRESLSFGIQVFGVDSSGRIERKLRDLFEQQGFTTSMTQSRYHISARLTMTEETSPTFVFVRPGLTVSVENAGRVLFSYSKNYPRTGHQSFEGACLRSFPVIEKDLEENFMKQFAGVIGR